MPTSVNDQDRIARTANDRGAVLPLMALLRDDDDDDDGSSGAADCWWKVRYNYPDESTDTTTWSAYIEGNPVHLVE